jgi:hypothetical protein
MNGAPPSAHLVDKDAPAFIDKFWEIMQMLETWQSNMHSFSIPSWIVCLNDSMSIWARWFTFLGWDFCPRKQDLFGNENHAFCCGKSGILNV